LPRKSLTHYLILTAALLIGAGPYLVRAAALRPDQGLVANVDMQRVFAESEARQTASARVRGYAAAVSQRFDETSRLTFLNAQEIGEYSEIINAEKPTDAQKQRAEALKAESAKRADEMQKLSTKKEADLTPQDHARMKELAAVEQQRPQALEGLRRIYQNMVSDEEAKQMNLAQAEVRVLVGKMAKEQGFTEVFDTTALVYAPIDLTPNALLRVKKK
jgi:Skp family chaperone for outer membrane proteins